MHGKLGVLVSTLLLATACSGANPERAASPSSPEQPTVTPSVISSPNPSYPPHVTAIVPSPVEFQWRTGPANPVIGTAYPFDLYAHCGTEWTLFGGATWRMAEPRLSFDKWAYVAGTMELLDSDTARFVIDLRHTAAPVEFLIYRRVPDAFPACK